MIVSGAVGTLTPLFFKMIKIDPAAVVVYYGTSRIFLINMLHLS